MFNEEYIKSIKNDAELTELRNQYYAITGEVASIDIMHPPSVKEWKEDLHIKLNALKRSTTSQ